MAPFFRTLTAALLTLGAAGCASTSTTTAVSSADQNDPYEAQNRKIFAFNETFDRNVMLPIATFYVKAVPEPARDGLHNFLVNLDVPVTFANDVMQRDPDRAANSIGRFVINSTFGIGGLIDVAAKLGVPEHDSDFGETLAAYGVGEGPYLVLPMLGPSNPRDAIGYGADIALDPSTWITWRSSEYFLIGRGMFKILDERANNIETINDIERSSVDLYATFRSLYRQHRQAEINHGKANIDNLPNF